MRQQIVALITMSLAGCPASCPPNPPPVHTVDSGVDAAPVSEAVIAACSTLSRLGCPEGGDRCASVLQSALDARITTISPQCIAAASSQAEVRGCGGVRCSVP